MWLDFEITFAHRKALAITIIIWDYQFYA